VSASGAGRPSAVPFVRPLPATDAYARLLSPPESVGLCSGLVTLAPGVECGEHTTGAHEELIICLSGEGEIQAEGLGRARLAAGHMAYNPPDTRHNVRNTGAVALRYVFVVAPQGSPSSVQADESH